MEKLLKVEHLSEFNAFKTNYMIQKPFFRELLERGGAFAEFLKTYLQEQGEGEKNLLKIKSLTFNFSNTELMEEIVEKRESDAKPIDERR